jgi:hypothetical protein
MIIFLDYDGVLHADDVYHERGESVTKEQEAKIDQLIQAAAAKQKTI